MNCSSLSLGSIPQWKAFHLFFWLSYLPFVMWKKYLTLPPLSTAQSQSSELYNGIHMLTASCRDVNKGTSMLPLRPGSPQSIKPKLNIQHHQMCLWKKITAFVSEQTDCCYTLKKSCAFSSICCCLISWILHFCTMGFIYGYLPPPVLSYLQSLSSLTSDFTLSKWHTSVPEGRSFTRNINREISGGTIKMKMNDRSYCFPSSCDKFTKTNGALNRPHSKSCYRQIIVSSLRWFPKWGCYTHNEISLEKCASLFVDPRERSKYPLKLPEMWAMDSEWQNANSILACLCTENSEMSEVI